MISLLVRFVVVLTIGVVLVSASAATQEPSQESSILGAYFGALVADALCLGSHYEYDAIKIKEAYNGKTILKYMAPGEQMGGETHGVGWGARNYHPGTVAGDQTDYGEYNVLILEYLASLSSSNHHEASSFTVRGLIPHWKKRLQSSWKQWVCTQTKQTFQQVNNGVPMAKLGGNSNAMALRYAAIFASYDAEEAVVEVARKTMFTHRERIAHLGNEFFARVTHRIIHGSGSTSNKHLTPRQAIVEVTEAMGDPWIQQKVKQAMDKVDEATSENNPLSKEEFVDDLALTSMARLWDVGKSEPIKVGKASPTEGTLPGSLYFILKYEDDFMSAVKANAMVGGDNASRSIAIGMVLGAYHGVETIPSSMKENLNHWEESEKQIRKLPLLKSGETNGKGADEL